MSQMRLIVFDVDGTLVDSQALIVGAMQDAFTACELPVPARADILAGVGLSLPVLMARLASEAHADALAEVYKTAYRDHLVRQDAAPLYEGVRPMLDRLAGQDTILLGVATGKSRRGLDGLLATHGLERHFVTRQVADDHPSKPHPSMLLTALAETGVEPQQAVMVGDTSFDMDMAQAAGIAGIGVSWGYHSRAALRGATCIIDEIAELPDALAAMWSTT